jgi:hypothetical protein
VSSNKFRARGFTAGGSLARGVGETISLLHGAASLRR